MFQGSGILVDKIAMDEATKKSSVAGFINTLLINLFSRSDLLESNYGGGASKSFAGGDKDAAIKRPGLDKPTCKAL